MSESWLFRLAGPLEVRRDGVRLPIDAAKQRVLIAVLALAAGEPVTVERLIACLWDDQPPVSARNTLQNYVLRLRRTLQVDGPNLLVSSAAGYRLDTDPDTVDVLRFRALVRSARSDLAGGGTESAAALLDEALDLWRGEPLMDVPSEVLRREVVPGLVEQRLDALEQRIGLDLDLGRHDERITELVALTTEYPLRERMWAHLMLALYRSGRTAEALDTYRQAGRTLAEELGVDPGPELRNLHQAMLTEDPVLTIADPTPEPVRRPSAAARVVPRQLPPPTTHFVGRAAEVRRLSAQFETAEGSLVAVISSISGTAGIGKTALALHWGHAHADRFPDGQLYVNLRGFDPADEPLSPLAAMHGFLTALGVRNIPVGRDEQVALYRTHLAGRRMLVVLDNARDAEQVRPLLPGAPGCLVLVTSRDQLAGLVALDGAVPLTLDLLTREEARDLLIRRLGRDRIEREQDDVEELIDRCARLPLALNIAAAHAALHPDRPLAAFVDELRDTRRRLDALSTGEAAADVRAVFSWSYHALSPAAARLFRLMGVHPGQDSSLLAAASLSGHDPDTTRRTLDELTRAHLIIEHSPGRYTLHDLLRAYAAEQARVHEDDADLQAALRRLVDFYTHSACAAEVVLTPYRQSIELDAAAPGVQQQPIPDSPAALAWLDAENANILAAQQTAVAHAWHSLVWQLAWSLIGDHERRGHTQAAILVWQAALDAAAHLPDPRAGVIAHRRLCVGFANLGRHEESIEHGQQALDLTRKHGDLGQEAETHIVLSWLWDRQQDYRQVLEHATLALELRRTLGQPVREAQALNHMGWALAHLGEFDTARTHCEAALALMRSGGSQPRSEAFTLDALGYIAHQDGRHKTAVEYYQEALSLYGGAGHVRDIADTLDSMGHPYSALGEYEQARAAWRKALELYRQQGRDEAADDIEARLDGLGHFIAQSGTAVTDRPSQEPSGS